MLTFQDLITLVGLCSWKIHTYTCCVLKLICSCGRLQVEDQYGSPSLDEVSIFSREFYSSLEAKVGEQAAGKLSVEVSSPVGLLFLLLLPRHINSAQPDVQEHTCQK